MTGSHKVGLMGLVLVPSSTENGNGNQKSIS